MELVEGKEITLEGIIFRSAKKGKPIFYLVTEEKRVEIFYSGFLQEGLAVKITGTVENHYGFLKIKIYSLEELSNEKYSEIEQKIQGNVKIENVEFLVKDNNMESMKDQLIKIAKKLSSASKLGRKIIVRFHNDGDGISGGLSFSKFLRANYIQQISAVYTVKDAMRDMNELTNSNNPLLVLVDFGSGEESKEALSLIKASGIELILVDHHQLMENLSNYSDLFVNPWTIIKGETASKYTAGYLASEIARLLGKDTEFFAKTALCSDKSDLLEYSEKEKEFGIVLNYSAAYSSYSSSLSFYSSLLENEILFQSILMQAQEKIDNLISVAKHNLKEKQIGKFKLFSLNLGSVVKRFEFPGMGKSATQIFDYLIPKDEPCLLIGYGPRTLVFRVTEEAEKQGADSLEIISYLKKTMPNIIESGGGHTKAAAVRVNEGFEKSVLTQIEEFLSSK